ncbi:hypothetical protein GFB49_17585 [Epibacterium sp. SM1979]|uniref:Uncharacterized protein n=1 Tax=Tritonibacter litoralis TaxID=2662264 RepID=A0A843YM56_9RHOB|nr:hypothetical protein [Tritonibacter litoralis]MQQ10283.1 hypothetical protein [Tritonibacter litoralis]
MALKIASGSWDNAADQSRSQRDSLRQAFFAQAGIEPANSLRQIFLSPTKRISRIAEISNHSVSPRIDDPSLTQITNEALKALAVTGLSVPALAGHSETQPLSRSAMAPEVLRSFFSDQDETSLDQSLF